MPEPTDWLRFRKLVPLAFENGAYGLIIPNFVVQDIKEWVFFKRELELAQVT